MPDGGDQPCCGGPFDQQREFRLDRRWGLYEDPVNGWSVQLPQWDHELFPAPGEPLEMHLDAAAVPFAVRDAPLTTTYAGRSASGELELEDRTETKRILRPAEGHEAKLAAWIERHYVPEEEAETREPSASANDVQGGGAMREAGRSLPISGPPVAIPSVRPAVKPI